MESIRNFLPLLYDKTNNYIGWFINPKYEAYGGTRRLAEILIGFVVGSLAITFAAILIQNYLVTSNWGFAVIPPPLILVLVYGGIILGVGLGIVGSISTQYRLSRTLLFAAWIILAVETYAFLTDGFFIFVLPSAFFFCYLWAKRPALNKYSKTKDS